MTLKWRSWLELENRRVGDLARAPDQADTEAPRISAVLAGSFELEDALNFTAHMGEKAAGGIYAVGGNSQGEQKPRKSSKQIEYEPVNRSPWNSSS